MGPILIAGCGKLGQQLANLPAQSWQQQPTFWGLKRSMTPITGPIQPLVADLATSDLQALLGQQAWHTVLFTATPKAGTAEDYEHTYLYCQQRLLTALKRACPRLRRYLFVSSTAVFSQDGGEWLDDDSLPNATPFRGSTMLAAEQLAQQAQADHRICVRLGGIYDGASSSLRRYLEPNAPPPDHSRWINRIHRQDAARILQFVIEQSEPLPSYLGVDHQPASTAMIVAWLAQQPEPPPPHLGKRCYPKRLLAQGFSHQFPTYKQGFEICATAKPSTDKD